MKIRGSTPFVSTSFSFSTKSNTRCISASRLARVAGSLTIVFTRKNRGEVVRLLDASPIGLVVSTLEVSLDEDRAVQVAVLRGRSADLAALAGRMAVVRGVLAAELTLGCVEAPARTASP